MNEDKLIKQKLKQGKKKAKENLKKEKINKKQSECTILLGIILGVIHAFSTYVIAKDTTYWELAMICYIFISSYAIIRGLSSYNCITTHKGDYFQKSLAAFVLTSTICLIYVGMQRELGFLTVLLIIVNLVYGLTDTYCTPNSYLEQSSNEYYFMNKMVKKAIKMQLRKSVVVCFILAVIEALVLSGVYKSGEPNLSEAWAIIIVTVIAMLIWNLIAMVILKVSTKKLEMALNAGFDLNIGGFKAEYSNSVQYNTRLVYNYSVLFYRTLALIVSIIVLLIYTKFNISISIIMTTVYVIINLCYPRYDEAYIYTGTQSTVATIYDKNGNKTGEIKKYD